MRVDEVMTTGVATVHADASISEAIGIMGQQHVSGLPVLDANEALVGMLTEGDLLRRVETGTETHRRAGWLDIVLGSGREAVDYVRTHSRHVEDLMTRDVVTATEDTPLDAVVALMEKRHVKRLPITRDGKLVGILSRADLVRALGRTLQAEAMGGTADTLIGERLQAEFSNQRWLPAGDVTYTVQNGVVTLAGRFSDPQARAALRVLAENVPGVTKVEDKLEWFDPVAGVVF